MSSTIVDSIDRYIDQMSSGQLVVPTLPTGPILILDVQGAAAEDANDDGIEPLVTAEDFEPFSPVAPGQYEMTALRTAVSLTVGDNWMVFDHIAGHTAFGSPESEHPGDLDVALFRPQMLTDPTQPWAPLDSQDAWPLDDIEGWLDNIADGIQVGESELVEVGGQTALYFEAEITDADVCGTAGYCAAFIVNQVFENGAISGWAFSPGVHQRIWWIDRGTEPPFVIVAGTPSGDRSFQPKADELINSLVIGAS